MREITMNSIPFSSSEMLDIMCTTYVGTSATSIIFI